jgi:hypothetical protein
VSSKWRDPYYWSWWWRNRVSPDAKIVVAVVAVGLLGIGGYVAANGLEASVAGPGARGDEVELVTTTVQKLVTVRADGEAVTTPARVVARVADGSVAADRVTQVRVETVGGGTQARVVTRREVVPVVRRERVTVAGGVRTVVREARAETQTVERVVDQVVERVVERTVTQERPVTVDATQTVTQTVVVTVSGPPVTVTAGPITMTVTVPLPTLPRP